ncbi:hypothetical protein E2C01_029538 [Portunus trituberculatus]|uniref:Uncharacterized protein n=1 Tax=Portunus trituberculatus TaxID=210409 RepID=A0A5B7EN71_PORTR|nr:hypothetical protein [Portunus trituberculatus]
MPPKRPVMSPSIAKKTRKFLTLEAQALSYSIPELLESEQDSFQVPRVKWKDSEVLASRKAQSPQSEGEWNFPECPEGQYLVDVALAGCLEGLHRSAGGLGSDSHHLLPPLVYHS